MHCGLCGADLQGKGIQLFTLVWCSQACYFVSANRWATTPVETTVSLVPVTRAEIEQQRDECFRRFGIK